MVVSVKVVSSCFKILWWHDKYKIEKNSVNISIVPGVDSIPSYASEMIIQVEGAHISKLVGWVVMRGSEVWRILSKCIINLSHTRYGWLKNNKYMSPMEAINKIICSSFKKAMVHWVVFRIVISDTLRCIYAYTWSYSHVSYFLSTTKDNSPSEHSYMTLFEEGFGGVA